MKVKFLGAAGTVTGSSYVLTSGSGQSILIDLGMFQGTPKVEKLNYEPFDYDCSRLAGAVVTHAHLDHCGRLPILLTKGYEGDIWMTPPTRDLTELSLLDSAKVAKQDGRQILYDKNLAIKTIDRFKTVEYRTPFKIADFTINMRDAGHILGSASLEIEDTKPSSGLRKIVFSGDLGNSPEDLLEKTELIDAADVVVIESTYGDRLHPSGDGKDVLQSEINSIEATGEVLLIPAFSLNKTQELLHTIMHFKNTGKVKAETPIYLDSPMGQKATEIYLRYPGLFNTHIQNDFKEGGAFQFSGLDVIDRKKASDALHELPGPKVIIAGSGMMTGGRILAHAKFYLGRASTRLFITGYQGEGTLGREILEGSKQVAIDGEEVNIKANVTSTQSMSSHADQSQLIDWLKHIKNVKKVFITHGEDAPREALAKKITEEVNIDDISRPTLNQEIEI